MHEAATVVVLICMCFSIGFYNWNDFSVSDAEAGLLYPVSRMIKEFPGQIIIPMDWQGHTSGNIFLAPVLLLSDDPSLV